MRLRFTILLILSGFFLQAQTLVQYDRDSLQRVRNPFTRDWDLVRRNMDDPGNKFTVKFVKDSFNAVINPYSPEREFNLVRRETAGEGSFIFPFNKSLYDVVNNPFTGHYDLLEKPAAEPETGDPLILEWDNIANVPVADAESVSDWNTFYGLPTNGDVFTSVTVVGNSVYLYGGGNMTLTNGETGYACGEIGGNPQLFESNAHIKWIDDQAGVIVAVADACFLGYDAACENVVSILETCNLPACLVVGDYAFNACIFVNPDFSGLITAGANSFYECASLNTDFPLLESVGLGCFANCFTLSNPNFSALTTAGAGCFYGCASLVSPDFSALTTTGDGCFGSCTVLTTINIPLCTTLGTTTGDDGVFNDITGLTITVTCDASLLTCNAGAPDGDLCALAAYNTVTVNGAPLSGCPE